MFLVSVGTISYENHMQIPCREICAKFQDYREDKKKISSGQPMDLSALLCSICMVCILHIKPFSLLVDIPHTLCPRWILIFER